MSGLGGRSGFHDGGGMVQVIVLTCLVRFRYHMICLCINLPMIASVLACTTHIMCNYLACRVPACCESWPFSSTVNFMLMTRSSTGITPASSPGKVDAFVLSSCTRMYASKRRSRTSGKCNSLIIA